MSLFLIVPYHGVYATDNPFTTEYKLIRGTIDEIDEITNKREVHEISVEYGKTLDMDHSKYEDQVRIKNDIPLINRIINENPSEFAGHYYNSEDGTVVVMIKINTEGNINKIYRNIKNKDKIKFKEAKYSKQEIDNAKDTIREKAPAGLVKALIPDVKNNKLIISLTELSDDNISIIKNLIPESDLIEFIPSIKVTLTAPDNTSYGSMYPMGSRISKSASGGCTSSYVATDSSNKDVVVTAGHCDSVGSTSDWYQAYSTDTPSIGKWGYRTTSSDPNGTDKTSDAGYIIVKNKSPYPYIPYPSSTFWSPFTGVYVEDTVGETIYYRGATAGDLVWGEIEYSNVDVWYGLEGYGYVRSLVFSSFIPQPGDSGAPVVTDFAWDDSLGKYTFDLAGTVSGIINIEGHSIIEDGVYGLYSPIWTTFNDLNLTGLYLVD